MRSSGKTCLLLVVILCLAVTAVQAQEPSRTLRLINADSTTLITTAAGINQYCYGNVVFELGADRVACDLAVWLRALGRLHCSGKVKLTQPGRVLTADSVVYSRDERIARAFGHALLIDSLEHVRIAGERMVYSRDLHLAICDSLPHMVLDFDDSAAYTEISGRRLQFDRQTRRGWAEDSVIVRRADWEATCGKAESQPDSGLIVLTVNPVGRGNNAETSGDSITLYTINKQLSSVTVSGNAEALYYPAPDSATADSAGQQPEQNWIWGKRIVFSLDNNRLERIDAYGSARSQYLPGARPASGELRGENHTSGDTLSIYLAENKVERAEIRGGAQGTYYNPVGAHTAAVDTVKYSSEIITFLPDSSRIGLTGGGKIDYGSINLTADLIHYNTGQKTLYATGRPHPDSADALVGPPILMDGNQTVYGRELFYNLNTGRGRITGSFTEFEKAYYRGEDFRRYSAREFYVEHGSYTTCDREHPHFTFRGKLMKLVQGDKVISRPVVLHIDELPVFAIPYYVFPIKPGRHSGFLPLRIGNFEQGRRFVDNIGYYWAASEYWDVEAAVNIREETGLQYRGALSYALRYILNGSLSGTYARESTWNKSATPPVRTRSTRWSLVASHRHTVSPTLSVSGSANFISDASYYTDFSYDLEDRLNRELRSQININKRWQGSSLTMAAEHVNKLDTDEKTMLLPSLNFSLMQKSLIPAPADPDAARRWYHAINYKYSVQAAHNVYQRTTGDKRYATAYHAASISGPQTILQYVTVTPSIDGNETWYYVFDTDDAREAGVLTATPARRGSFSMGVSARTILYGFLYPHLAGLEAVRHTMTPAISYSFNPAVTVHDELRSYTGRGGGSARRAQTVSFSLGHNLDAKIGSGDNEKKVSLFTGSMSSGYNFEADERKWSYLNSSLRTRLARQIDLSVTAVHDLYNAQTLQLQATNPRLTNLSFSAAASLAGSAMALTPSALPEQADTISPTGLPFNASISYRYSESRSLSKTTKQHWIGGSVQISPTPSWRVSYSMNYDLAGHGVTNQSYTFYRDLHCWEGQFEWVPGGGRQGYYFKINVKAIPDVKIEKSESGLRGAFR
jgi:lipopolysaccharide assembly outer membrane protein LptD (OstA)